MERKGFPKRWIIIGVSILLYGCATADDIRFLESEMHQLRSQLNVIQKDMEPLRKSVEGHRKEVSQEITALQKQDIMLRDHLSSELTKARADFNVRIEKAEGTLQSLSTGIEEYKDLLKKPSKDVVDKVDRLRENITLRTKSLEEKEKALAERNRVFEERIKAAEERFKLMEDRFRWVEERFKGLDSQMGHLSSKQVDLEKRVAVREAVEKEPFPPPPPSPPALVKQPPPPVAGSEDLYKDAFNTFEKGDIEGARKKFENFLKHYPNAERSNNAQFWLGETYYRQKDYEKAILEYENVINRYPDGEKVPDALYKQALAFLELGDKNNARNLLKRFIERYPNAKQAEAAKKRLKGLK